MYICSSILFLLPCSLLLVAWSRVFKSGPDSARPNWRTYCLKAAVLVASLVTLASMAFIASWLSNGGSPHGLDPAPGLWKPLGPLFGRSVVLSVVLAALGKGKGRLLLVGSALANIFAVLMVLVLEMD
jgi:hypothetical protein